MEMSPSCYLFDCSDREHLRHFTPDTGNFEADVRPRLDDLALRVCKLSRSHITIEPKL